jgi:hypothetical protein
VSAPKVLAEVQVGRRCLYEHADKARTHTPASEAHYRRNFLEKSLVKNFTTRQFRARFWSSSGLKAGEVEFPNSIFTQREALSKIGIGVGVSPWNAVFRSCGRAKADRGNSCG